MESVIYVYAYALLALAQAKCAAKLNLVCDRIFVNKGLELFNYLAGTFDVARTTDAYCDFHRNFLSYLDFLRCFCRKMPHFNLYRDFFNILSYF